MSDYCDCGPFPCLEDERKVNRNNEQTVTDHVQAVQPVTDQLTIQTVTDQQAEQPVQPVTDQQAAQAVQPVTDQQAAQAVQPVNDTTH
jgi:hypothetical protein